MLLLDGKIARDYFSSELQKTIANLEQKPCLAIIQVGEREESSAYIKQKKIFGEKIGATVKHILLPENVSEDDVCDRIQDLNTDESVHGIIVQLPLPAHIDKNNVIQIIDPIKDIDGLTSVNIKLLWSKMSGHVPATARGIITLLEYYKIPIKGKKVVVVGRSDLVGKPTAIIFLNKGAIVTVCHRETIDLPTETKRADILIVATGKHGLITKDFVSVGQVVVDVGISVLSDKRLVGDVVFDDVKNIVSAISPVPGGVGPMTVLSLFQNLLDAYFMQGHKIEL